MAADIDPTDLAENARCIQCGIPDGLQMSVLIYLFCQIANVDPDPTYLAEQARCLQCGLPPGIQGSVLIYLAAQIASGSGGGLTTFGNYGGGQPNFTPASGTGLAVDTSNGTLWQYYNGAWH